MGVRLSSSAAANFHLFPKATQHVLGNACATGDCASLFMRAMCETELLSIHGSCGNTPIVSFQSALSEDKAKVRCRTLSVHLRMWRP